MFRYLLENSLTDGYLLEDGSGVLLMEESSESSGLVTRIMFVFKRHGRR